MCSKLYSFHFLFTNFLLILKRYFLTGPVVSSSCLGCISQAIGGVGFSACNGDVCGPYFITEPYWTDAGKPVKAGDSATSTDGKKFRFNKYLFLKCILSRYTTDKKEKKSLSLLKMFQI